jgi:CRP-like cAMP-binding protein
MRRKIDHRVEVLEALPLFAGCSRKQLEHLARSADEIDVASGETLVAEGTEGHHAYVLVEGLAHASIGGRRLGTIMPGSVFGEMAILDPGARSATVTTALPSRLLALDARRFRGLLAESPGVAARVMSGMARRLRAADEALRA